MITFGATAVLAIGFLLGWAVLNQRKNLRREVDSKLSSAVLRTEDGGVLFCGRSAEILLWDYTFFGTEGSGPRVSAKYLCKMPDAGAFWVLVDSASENEPASVDISELSQAEVDDVLATYPYLKQLRALCERDA